MFFFLQNIGLHEKGPDKPKSECGVCVWAERRVPVGGVGLSWVKRICMGSRRGVNVAVSFTK